MFVVVVPPRFEEDLRFGRNPEIQIIIYRGGGFSAIWTSFPMVSVIGLGFFTYSLALFRRSITVTK